jgi:hypothetical protein
VASVIAAAAVGAASMMTGLRRLRAMAYLRDASAQMPVDTLRDRVVTKC